MLRCTRRAQELELSGTTEGERVDGLKTGGLVTRQLREQLNSKSFSHQVEGSPLGRLSQRD